MNALAGYYTWTSRGISEFPFLLPSPETALRGQTPSAAEALDFSALATSSVTAVCTRPVQTAALIETNVEVDLPKSSVTFPSAREAERRWSRFKQTHWPREGRERRISQGLEALDSAIVDYGLDIETIRWIAEDVDLEDL